MRSAILPTWGKYYWPVALVVMLLEFGVPEYYAIRTNVYNTLSDFSRWQLAEFPGEPLLSHDWQWFASQALFLVFSVWIIGHIWYYIWG